MKGLTLTQVEQLKQIGEYLHNQRQEKSVSLEEIAVETYIPLRLLHALELGQVDRLPEPVYVQGFIRRYADALELDGSALAQTFAFSPIPTMPPETDSSDAKATNEQEVESPVMTRAAIETNTPAPVTPVPLSSTFAQSVSKRRTSPQVPVALVGVAVAVIVGGIAVGQFRRSQSNSEKAVTSPSSAAVSSSDMPQAASPNQPAAPSTPPNSATSRLGAAPIEVSVSLTDDCWIEVSADGDVKLSETLKKGQKKTWTAKNRLIVVAGNAGAVMLSYNQGAAEPMGDLGQPVERTFTPDQAQSQ